MTKGELRTWTKVVILYKQNYNVSSCQLETSNSLRRNLTSRSWPCDCLYMRPWDNCFILIEKQFVNRLELSVQVACNDNYNTLHVCITRYHIIFKSHKARKSQICVREHNLKALDREEFCFIFCNKIGLKLGFVDETGGCFSVYSAKFIWGQVYYSFFLKIQVMHEEF